MLLAVLLAPSLAAAADAVKEAIQKGEACLKKDDNDGAIAAFSEVLRLDPKNVEALRGRGRAGQ